MEYFSLANCALAGTLLLDTHRLVKGGCEIQYALLALLWATDAALYHTGLVHTIPILKDLAGAALIAAVVAIYSLYLSLALKHGSFLVMLTLGSAAAYVYSEVLGVDLHQSALNHAQAPMQVTHPTLLAVDLALLPAAKARTDKGSKAI